MPTDPRPEERYSDLGRLTTSILDALGAPQHSCGDAAAIVLDRLRPAAPEASIEAALLDALTGALLYVRRLALSNDARLLARLADVTAEMADLATIVHGRHDPTLVKADQHAAAVARIIADLAKSRSTQSAPTPDPLLADDASAIAAFGLADPRPASPDEIAARYDRLSDALNRHGIDADVADAVADAYRARHLAHPQPPIAATEHGLPDPTPSPRPAAIDQTPPAASAPADTSPDRTAHEDTSHAHPNA